MTRNFAKFCRWQKARRRQGQLDRISASSERARTEGCAAVHFRQCLGLVKSLVEFYPEARWQRGTVHFYRNVWTVVPTSKVKKVAAMRKAIHAQEDRAAARQKAEQIAAKPKGAPTR
jgi:putative transposase